MEKGYKGLKIELTPEGIPQLVSPTYRHVWKEETEEVAPSFSEGASFGEGFYSLKTPEDVKAQGYWHPKKFPNVLAEIIPHGKVVHGEKGYRSEKASLSAIFQDDYTCDACNKDIGTVLVYRSKEEVPILLCKPCLDKAKKVLPKRVQIKELGIENFWHTLSKRYGVPLARLDKGK